MADITTIGPVERVHVLVDGSNLRGALRLTKYDRIDVAGFRGWLAAYGRPTIDWFQKGGPGTSAFHNVLRGSGVRVIAPPPKVLPDGRLKGDLDVALAVT